MSERWGWAAAHWIFPMRHGMLCWKRFHKGCHQPKRFPFHYYLWYSYVTFWSGQSNTSFTPEGRVGLQSVRDTTASFVDATGKNELFQYPRDTRFCSTSSPDKWIALVQYIGTTSDSFTIYYGSHTIFILKCCIARWTVARPVIFIFLFYTFPNISSYP